MRSLALLAALLVAVAGVPASAQDADEAAEALELSDDDLFGDDDLDDDDLFGDDDLFEEETGPEPDPPPEDAQIAEEPPEDAPTGAEAAGTEPEVADGAGEEPFEAETAAPPISVEPLEPAGDVEQILVRGQQVQGVAPDATVSVTSFGAEDLLALGVEDISDVAQYTPNLEIRTAGATTATFFIRGVGLNDFTSNAAGSVAVYQDDVALNLPAFQLGQVFDTSQLEVLKGPQGAGPGRNASAGAIRVFTNKPTGEFSASLRFDYGNRDYVDTEGALEIPLLPEVLATRLSFRLTKRDGIMRNRCGDKSRESLMEEPRPCSARQPIIKPNIDDDLNDIDTWAARGHLSFTPPASDLDFLLSAHTSKIDQLATVGQHLGTGNEAYLGSVDLAGYRQPEIAKEEQRIQNRITEALGLPGGMLPTPGQCRRSPDPAACFALREDVATTTQNRLSRHLAQRPLDRKPFEGDYNRPGHERMSAYGGFLRGEWELDAMSLTSITSAERYDRSRYVDADYSPNVLFEFDIDDDAWQITQDLRATGELENLPLQWNAGGYYLQEELDYEQIQTRDLTGALPPNDQTYEQKTWSFGIYAGFNWEILDDFELEAGARYNWERRKMDAEVFTSREVCVVVDGVQCETQRTFDEPTGTVSLTYFVNPEVSMYWKYSHGWKSSQFNVRNGVPAGRVIDVAKPEKIDAFEMGFEGNWLDGRVELSGALFWYDYEDYQVFTFTNDITSAPQRVVINANDARLYGGELETRLEPLEGLVATGRFGWLESRFLDFSDTGTRSIPGTGLFFEQVFDFNGNRLPNTPRFKVSGSLEYTLELGRYGQIVPRWDFSWTDDVYFDQTEGRGLPDLRGDTFLPQYAIGQKAYWIHNARLTYRTPSANIEVAAWIRNIADEVYKSQSFDASGSVRIVGNFVGDPRTYGGSLTIRF